jgi:plastocyanin
MTTSSPAIILGGSVSQSDQPLTIAEDYDQLITDTSAFNDSGSKTLYLDTGTISMASPAQIGRVVQGTTITAATVQANQDLLDAIGVYCRDNGISIEVAAALDLPSVDDWTYQWLAPAVEAGLPITAVEDIDEETESVADTPSNWETLATEAVNVVKQIAAYYPSVQIGWWEAGNAFAAMANQWNAYDQAASAAGVPTISYIVADTAWNTPWVQSYQGWLLQLSQTVSADNMKLDVLIDGTNSSGSDLQWTAQSEQHAEMLASLPGMTVNALIVKSWNAAYPNAVLPVDEPTTVGNDAAEIAATYPLYQAGAITAQNPVLIDAPSQVVTTINQVTPVGATASLVWGQSDLATNASVGVVIIDETGIISAAQSGVGTVTGSGSQVLVLSGDATDIAAELNSLTVIEPVSGLDTVDVEVFGVNGRVADAQIAVLTLPATPAAQGPTYEFTQGAAVQQWTTAIATVNQSGIVASETLYWNKTGINPLTGAYQAMDTDSIHEPLAESGVTLVNGIVEEPLANPPPGAASLPFVLPVWNPSAFNASTQLSTITVLQTTMSYGPQSGKLESVTDTLAPTAIPNSALPSDMVNYLASGGTQVTQINSGDNPNWLPDWSNKLASITTTYDSAGTVIEQSFQGGAAEPFLTLDNVFDPNTGQLWEQIETLPPPAPYSSFATGDELVTQFNTGDNPNWDYVDWGNASQVTVTYQDFYVTSVSLDAPLSTGMQTTDAYTSTGCVSPDGQLSITGGVAGCTTTDTSALSPLATVAIRDANIAQTETLSVTLPSPSDGSLSSLDGGSYNATTGVYTDTGSAAEVTTALDNLVFTPSAVQVAPGQTITTDFIVTDTDTAGAIVTSSSAAVGAAAGIVSGNNNTINAVPGSTVAFDGTGEILNGSSVAVAAMSCGSSVTVIGDGDTISGTTQVAITQNGTNDDDAIGAGSTIDCTATNACMIVNGSSITITASAGDAITLTGTDDVASFLNGGTITESGANCSVSIVGNDVNAALPSSGQTISATGSFDVVSASAGATVVMTGNNDVVGSSNSSLTFDGLYGVVYGSGNTITATTPATSVIVFGDDNTVSSENGDTIMMFGTADVVNASNSIVYSNTGSIITVNGNSDFVNAATDSSVTCNGAGDAVTVTGTNDLVTFLNGGTISESGTNCSASIVGSGVAAGLSSSGQTLSATGSFDAISATAGATVATTGNNDVVGSSNSSLTFDGLYGVVYGSEDAINATTPATSVIVFGDANTVASGDGDTVTIFGTADVVNGSNTTLYSNSGSSLTANGNNDFVASATDSTITCNGRGDAVSVAGTNNSVTFLNGGTITEHGPNCSASVVGSGVAAGLSASGQTINATGSFDAISASAGATVTTTGNNDVVGSSNSSLTFDGLYGVVYGSADAINAASPATSVIVFGNSDTVSSGTGDTITIFGTGDVVNGANTTLYGNGGSSITLNGNNDVVAAIAGSSITLNGINEEVYGSDGTVDLGTNASVDLGGGTSNVVNNVVIGSAVNLAGGAAATINGNGGQVDVSGTNIAITTSNETITTVASSSFTLAGSDDTIVLASSSSMNISGSEGLGFIVGAEDSLTIQANQGTQTVSGFNPANGDQIDLSQILAGVSLTPDLGNIGNYLSVAHSGSNTALVIAAPNFHDTVLLTGVGALSLQNLVNDHAFYLPPH